MNVIRLYCFEAYGLNKYRNFLKGKFLRGYSEEDVFEYCIDALNQYECDDSAIFIHSFNDEMYVVSYDYDDEIYKVLQSDESDQDFFSLMDGENRWCCYALIVESRPGLWRIVDG